MSFMKSFLILLLSAFLFSSCEKDEGLSDDTGNLEVVIPNNSIGFDNYQVFTEEQYYKYRLQPSSAVALFSGGIPGNSFTITNMGKGYYGVRVWGNGYEIIKVTYVQGNKNNKLLMQ